MNPGGEPERDDTGLPPVDIEIPDDARDLDRDVQAYHRELRAERRRQHWRSVHHRFGSDGIVLPLLACCLILALITGTLLTIFTATSDQNLTNVPGGRGAPTSSRIHGTSGSASPSSGSRSNSRTPATGASRSASPSSSASSPASSGTTSGATAITSPHLVSTSASLPTGALRLAGNVSLQLSALSGTILVLVPTWCRCTAAVRWLAGIGAQQHAPTFIVGKPGSVPEAERLYRRLGTVLQAYASLAVDPQSVLWTAIPVSGLTIVVVGSEALEASQYVSYADQVTAGGSAAAIVQALAD